MPDSIFHPGGSGLVEFQFHLDARPAHDGQRILHEGVEIEMQRHLIGMVGGRDGLDPLHGKHARLTPQMAISNQVEAAGGVPEAIGIHFAPGRSPARRGVVADLHGRGVGDGSGEAVDGFAMLPIAFVRTETHAEGAVELLDQGHALRRQRGGGLA